MRGSRIRGIAAGVVLWTGCLAGVICLAWTIGVLAARVTPLVFLSGSMGPTINAGDLAFARTVPAAELRPGDVVSVPNAQGTRITHRITATVPAGGAAYTLTLKGDANAAVDADTYTVAEADRVVASVPGMGHVLNAAASPWALMAGGALAAGALTIGFTTRRDGRGPISGDRAEESAADQSSGGADRIGRRQGIAGVTAVTVLLGMAVAATSLPQLRSAAATPTLAAWSDTAAMRSENSTHKLTAPAQLTCTTTLLGAEVKFTWKHVDARYDYRVSRPDYNTTTVTGTGAVGSELSVSFRDGGINTDVIVQSRLKGSSTWVSSGAATGRYQSPLLGLKTCL